MDRPLTRAGLLPPLVAGLGLWLYLPLGGRLSLTELAALVLAPPCLFALLKARRGPAVLGTGLLWLAGLTVSTLLRPAPGGEVLRAFASLGTLVVTIGLLCLVLRSPDADPAALRRRVLLGFAWGQLAGLLVTPPTVAALDPWKFGAGQAVTLLVLLAAERLRPRTRRYAVPVLLFLLAAGHLVTGSRSLAVLTVAAGLAAVLAPLGGRRRGRARVVALAVAVAIGALVLQQAYVTLANEGELGAAQQQKVRFQEGDFGLLVGGRKDAVFLLGGIAASPVLGWGPGAVVPPEVKATALDWLESHHYPVYGYDRLTLVQPPELYLHSILLGAWATAGIGALPFWLLALVLLARGLTRALRRGGVAEVYVLLVAFWHVWFSPLGDTTRGHLALALALALTSVSRREEPPEPVAEPVEVSVAAR
ncbi:hypothetical protein Amsp01_050450 [Amycolatopsis sp. NBRC 101858]|uniref:hypothetical protein n=1 Tax=Amycolatopsis sp. NBRC 101858 TaxID=3032200 RepID=UPI0024A44BF4|nr:hypothetical protein [Amycolatopsis sp. NBRC 101858]GLY39021.1 hypothetical protein Amsp01_050450 [Amycolatopsis sp. NBRC 101858]